MKMTKVQALYNVLNGYDGMDNDTRWVLEGMVAQLEKPRQTSDEAKAKAKADEGAKLEKDFSAKKAEVLTGLEAGIKKVEDALAEAFSALFAREEELRAHLHTKLPAYIHQAQSVADAIAGLVK